MLLPQFLSALMLRSARLNALPGLGFYIWVDQGGPMVRLGAGRASRIFGERRIEHSAFRRSRLLAA